MEKFIIRKKVEKDAARASTSTNVTRADSNHDVTDLTDLSEITQPIEVEPAKEEENYSDSNEGLFHMRKKRKRNAFTQKFKISWITKDTEKWFEIPETGKAQCRVCNNVLVGGITHINRHGSSASHTRKMKSLRATPQIADLMTDSTKKKRLKEGIKQAEIKMVMFLAEHNLPFRLLEHLPQFLSSVCYDSEVAKHLQCGRKKGTKICTEITKPEHLRQVSEALKNTWFSLIIDESTDVSTQKCLTVLARYYNGKIIKDKYLGLIPVESGTAESLYTATKQLLVQNNIPISKMIEFAADNASVMQGNITSVQSKFKENIPDMFALGCVCHSLALCSGAACKKLPLSVEKLARDIGPNSFLYISANNIL